MRDILEFIRVTKRNFSVLACKPFLADMLDLEGPRGDGVSVSGRYFTLVFIVWTVLRVCKLISI